MLRNYLLFTSLALLLAGCSTLVQAGQPTATPGTITSPLKPTAAEKAPAASPQPAPTASPAGQKPVQPEPQANCSGPSGRYDEVVPSQTLGQDIPVRLYVPPCDPPEGQGWPVIYLLHGAGWTERHWDDILMDEAADAGRADGTLPPVILVYPRRTVETREPGPDGDLPFEHFVVSELIPWVDHHFPTEADRAHRAIGGISLGGFWALEIAFHHPELFDSVGGHSPVVGAPSDALSPMSLMTNAADKLSALRIWLDVGDQDSLGPGTAKLADGLKAAGLPVIFNQWPGLHKEPYWMEHTTDYLNFYTLPWKSSK
jgi:enterochelin esterase-like enzyme